MSILFTAATGNAIWRSDPPTTAFTWMAWVAMLSDTNNWNILVCFSAGDRAQLGTQGDGTTLVLQDNNNDSAGYAMALSTWTHVCWVHRGDSDNELWVNGSLIADSFVQAAPTGNLVVGTWSASDPNYGGSWAVADMKLWSAAISGAEIAQEMYVKRPLRTANLYSWLPTWPGATERIKDYSGNGRDWSVTPTISDVDNPPISWGGVPLFTGNPVSGGTGVTVSAELGLALALPFDASVSIGSTLITTLSQVIAAGFDASVSVGVTIAAEMGMAQAVGADASVSTGVTISAEPGHGIASGFDATLSAGLNISAEIGTGQAFGFEATVTTGAIVEAQTGHALAVGFEASVSTGVTVSAEVGLALALPLEAEVSALSGAIINADMGAAYACGFEASVAVTSNVSIAADISTALAYGFDATVDASTNIVIEAGAGFAYAGGLEAQVSTTSNVAIDAEMGSAWALAFMAAVSTGGGGERATFRGMWRGMFRRMEAQ
ncbi:MAG: hypothetical protein IT323_13540 [Anaerolineae bacterium]|nr:hypothetical protein [Anaerolineae bacterium]